MIIMEGQWFQNKLHGFGRCIDQYGNCYIGMYDHGQRKNYGQYFWANGDIYDGAWHKNQQYGYGTFYMDCCKHSYIGFWKKDALFFNRNLNDSPDDVILENYLDENA